MNNKFALVALFIFSLLSFFLSTEAFKKVDVFAIEAGQIFKPSDIKPPAEINGIKIGKVDNIEKIDNIYAYLKKLLNWVLGIFLSVAVVFIIWAGYTFMTGAGDEEKIKNARKRIVWAVVAIAVALLAGSFVLLIQNFFGVTGGSQQQQQRGGSQQPGTGKSNSYPGGPYQTQNQYWQQTTHTCSQDDINKNWCCSSNSSTNSDCCGGRKAGDAVICFR